jgi:signal transduction histidine kinase
MEKKPEKQKEYAEVIFQTTKRLSELISNILKLNKLEKQAITPVAEEYDLCRQLAECAVNYELVWEKKDIGFDADMEDSIQITADAVLMEIVWNNLFSNAVKFTEPGGTIKLTEQSDDSEIRVSVEDNGCGMTEETRKHIFEKFYQGDTSHAMAGNGLGLALALRVLQLNDYKIEVESEPGRGSKFTVIIPKR